MFTTSLVVLKCLFNLVHLALMLVVIKMIFAINRVFVSEDCIWLQEFVFNSLLDFA